MEVVIFNFKWKNRGKISILFKNMTKSIYIPNIYRKILDKSLTKKGDQTGHHRIDDQENTLDFFCRPEKKKKEKPNSKHHHDLSGKFGASPFRFYSLVFVIVVKSPVRFIFFPLLKFSNLEEKARTCYDTRVAYISQCIRKNISIKIFFKTFKITRIRTNHLAIMGSSVALKTEKTITMT